MKICCLDIGIHNTGISLSTKDLKLALPIQYFKYIKKINFINLISDFIKRNSILILIIGYPILLNGRKSKMTNFIELLVKDLKKTLKLPIILWDERLTSIFKINKNLTKFNNHMLSATIILQNFINMINYSDKKT